MLHKLRQPFVRFLHDEEGVTAVECALMLALVVVICLVALAPAVPSATAAPNGHVMLEVERG